MIAAPQKLAQLGLSWFGSTSRGLAREKEPARPVEASEARIAPGSPRTKTGLCALPWEDHTEEVLRRWLRSPAFGVDAMRVGGRRGRDTPEEAASKALSRLLRHEAGTPECPISPEGWVRWRDLLNHPRCRDHREDLLEWGVAHNSKDRFVAKQDTDGVWFAAAWSGHTIAGVTGPSREVDDYDTPQILVHGTYRQCVPSIKKQGILCMGRDIHLQNPEEHACRWRKDLEVKVVVDARAAQRAGCKFRKTGNLVWLTSQPIPNRAILRYEAWEDLPQPSSSSSSQAKADGGLWSRSKSCALRGGVGSPTGQPPACR